MLRAQLSASGNALKLNLSLPFDPGRTRGVLLDVEGTTTPIDFVSKTLFPYASTHVEEFLTTHLQDDDVRSLLDELRRCHERDTKVDPSLQTWSDVGSSDSVHSAVSYVRWLIGRDSKLTPLKTLQGKIWEVGYRSGELHGAVYPDVAPALARWRAQSRSVAIFSSGSVLAQKLLFGHSTAGDLTTFLDGFFDTTTGPKREGESYRQIAAALHVASSTVLFLSDTTAELDASRVAGMRTALVSRPGSVAPAACHHPIVRSFDEVF